MSALESCRTDNLVLATWEDVVLWIGSGDASEAEIGHLHDALTAAVSSVNKTGLVLWLPHRAAAPDSAGRTRAARMFREVGPQLAAFAVITEGGGFWASAIRSIITGLSLATHHSFAFKAFSTMNAAAPWLVEKLEIPTRCGELLRVSKNLRLSLPQWERD